MADGTESTSAADMSASFNDMAATLIPSGVETRINCRAWTDVNMLEFEIIQAIDDC